MKQLERESERARAHTHTRTRTPYQSHSVISMNTLITFLTNERRWWRWHYHPPPPFPPYVYQPPKLHSAAAVPQAKTTDWQRQVHSSSSASSSSSAFPARSLGFTIFGEIFANVSGFVFFVFCFFLSPAIEVVTFHLRWTGCPKLVLKSIYYISCSY